MVIKRDSSTLFGDFLQQCLAAGVQALNKRVRFHQIRVSSDEFNGGSNQRRIGVVYVIRNLALSKERSGLCPGSWKVTSTDISLVIRKSLLLMVSS